MFVGKDVAQALGYSNTSKAIQQHVDHEDKGTLPIRETACETRAVVINELRNNVNLPKSVVLYKLFSYLCQPKR
jgi:hypothetical protein